MATNVRMRDACAPTRTFANKDSYLGPMHPFLICSEHKLLIASVRKLI